MPCANDFASPIPSKGGECTPPIANQRELVNSVGHRPAECVAPPPSPLRKRGSGRTHDKVVRNPLLVVCPPPSEGLGEVNSGVVCLPPSGQGC